MSIQFRNYTGQAGITEDYYKVRAFLVKLGYAEFTYARWDWATTHSYLDKASVGKIGLWEENNEVVGLATFDCFLGIAYCLTLPDYTVIKRDILQYAMDHLSNQGEFGVVIADKDAEFLKIAEELGFSSTIEKEHDAAFFIDETSTEYKLPEGFVITSMEETFDLSQYRSVLWKGFNHELNGEGEFLFTKEREESSKEEMLRPNVNLSLKIAAVAPNGNFAAYCGMWYDPEAGFAVIEPVATDPDYRKLGLGRAVVLEGIRRVDALGAKIAFVGSSQQFYYSIGMRPYAASTVWRKPLEG